MRPARRSRNVGNLLTDDYVVLLNTAALRHIIISILLFRSKATYIQVSLYMYVCAGVYVQVCVCMCVNGFHKYASVEK